MRSTLPAAICCRYCSIAFAASVVDAPPARSALLNARDISVALERSPVSGASPCATRTTLSVATGRPSSESLIRLICLLASSEEKPMFAITFGKV